MGDMTMPPVKSLPCRAVPSTGFLKRGSDVFVLVQDVIRREVRIVLYLENADDAAGQISVRVKRHLALEGIQFGCLDGVANCGPGDRLAGCSHLLDGVQRDQRGIVGGD